MLLNRPARRQSYSTIVARHLSHVIFRFRDDIRLNDKAEKCFIALWSGQYTPTDYMTIEVTELEANIDPVTLDWLETHAPDWSWTIERDIEVHDPITRYMRLHFSQEVDLFAFTLWRKADA